MAGAQEATFEYIQWKELYEQEKPYEIFVDDVSKLKGLKRTNLDFQAGPFQTVRDVRGQEKEYSLDTHGFQWIRDEIDVRTLRDEHSIVTSYLPQVASLIKREVEGADEVVVFEWRTRLSTEDEVFKNKTVDLNNGLDPLRPVAYPHIDQTPESSVQRAFNHLGQDAEELLKGRFRIINIWRPLSTVQNWPLAVCDARSVSQSDLVATDFVRRKYIGENYFVKYNEDLRWHYLSKQEPNEALIFKVHDSLDTVAAKFCVHASFPVANAPPERPRESIECRALVFTRPAFDESTGVTRPNHATCDILRAMRVVYGTAAKGHKTLDLVESALKAGFRAFDTAAQPRHYNESAVGQALRAAISGGLVKRSDIWLQTKFSNIDGQDPENIPYDPLAPIADQVESSVRQSLDTIAGDECPYFDCVFLHAPLATLEETLEAWRALAAFVPRQIRSLGISNVPAATLAMLYERSTVKPAVVQNRFTQLTGYDTQVRRFCANHGIVYQAYGVLKSGLLNSEPVARLSKVAGIGLEEALYTLVEDLDILPLDGTSNKEHMTSDLAAFKKVNTWRNQLEVHGQIWANVQREFQEWLH